MVSHVKIHSIIFNLFLPRHRLWLRCAKKCKNKIYPLSLRMHRQNIIYQDLISEQTPSFPFLFPSPSAKESPPSFCSSVSFFNPLSSLSFSFLLCLSALSLPLPLPLLHPSPHSYSDVMPLCCESRGCRFTEPQRKV